MDLSIIIISYNSKQFIQKCINSLLASEPHLALETIIIDNASQDGSPDFVKINFPRVRLIANIINLGYAKACNQGIKEAGDIKGNKAKREEIKKVRDDLTKYCGLDTEAMIFILDRLKETIKGKN